MQVENGLARLSTINDWLIGRQLQVRALQLKFTGL